MSFPHDGYLNIVPVGRICLRVDEKTWIDGLSDIFDGFEMFGEKPIRRFVFYGSRMRHSIQQADQILSSFSYTWGQTVEAEVRFAVLLF